MGKNARAEKEKKRLEMRRRREAARNRINISQSRLSEADIARVSEVSTSTTGNLSVESDNENTNNSQNFNKKERVSSDLNLEKQQGNQVGLTADTIPSQRQELFYGLKRLETETLDSNLEITQDSQNEWITETIPSQRQRMLRYSRKSQTVTSDSNLEITQGGHYELKTETIPSQRHGMLRYSRKSETVTSDSNLEIVQVSRNEWISETIPSQRQGMLGYSRKSETVTSDSNLEIAQVSQNDWISETIPSQRQGMLGYSRKSETVTSDLNLEITQGSQRSRAPDTIQSQTQGFLCKGTKRKHTGKDDKSIEDHQSDAKLDRLEKKRIQYRKKYHEDENFRQKKCEAVKQRYRTFAEYKKRKRESSTGKYHDNPYHQKYVKKYDASKYRRDKQYRETKIQKGKAKYHTDLQYRDHLKTFSKTKYRTDCKHRERKKQFSKTKYRTDSKHREQVKQFSKTKYRTDSKHRERLKQFNKAKYADNQQFRTKIKTLKRLKYSKHAELRHRMLLIQRHRYASDSSVRQKKIHSLMEKRKERRDEENVVSLFREEISKKPIYVCCVCNKFFWRNQCMVCSPVDYTTKASDGGAMSRQCISTKYVHTCDDNCDQDCGVARSYRGKIWICYTCHRTLLKGQMPPEAHCNNLELHPIPEELSDLNELERHLLCLRIPFVKMVTLPKGGQKGVIGPCVSVPSDVQESTKVLPRSDTHSELIRVKLKRRLPYKGHYKYQYVDTNKLKVAFEFLQKNNKWYQEVMLDSTWQNPLPLPLNDEESDDDEHIDKDRGYQHANALANIHSTHEGTVTKSIDNADSTKPNQDGEERVDGVPIDTCLQPVDIGQEVLDQHFDQLFCVAPAQNNTPVSMLKEEGNEAMSFPCLYPIGCASFSDERPVRLTPLRYFHNRLMNADTRFSRDTTFIFYAQYLCELYQVISNVSIALRKGTAFDQQGNPITSSMISDNTCLKQILQSDQGYKFLKPVRGTPPYWQVTMKDLFAMIRQKGIPTWFCTFSAADMRWPEVMETISEQQGSCVNPEDLSWTEKSELLCSNPVMNAMMFNHRFNTFMKHVLLSDSHPIGHIDTRFHRIEFQQRGSPHTHCTFWVKDSPKLDEDEDETVCDFIDQYVTCHLPAEDEDPELHDIVSSVQQHSKSHSKSCKKKGTECRFNFPRPSSQRTFISRPKSVTDPSLEKSPQQLMNEAKQILKALWNVILDPDLDASDITTEALFEKAGITQEEYEDASNIMTKRTSIVLQRSPADVWINQYNPTLLRCWNANMDIQYIIDAYSCVMYIISYISKAEKELGMVLEETRKEAVEGNLDAEQAMKKIGSAYFHQREICVQEAVYRVCGFHLKESNCKVQFVPVGENPVRMSIPLQVIQKRSQNEEQDIWMSSLWDKYKARPKGKQFDSMCYASFCSMFRILSPSQVPKNPTNTVHSLQKNLGYIQQRTRSDPAVIRYPRFAVDKNPETYYQSLLQLFLPHRSDAQLKPPQFQTYQEFYESGVVKLSPSMPLTKVSSIVDTNRQSFEKNAAILDEAKEMMEKVGPLEDAWATLASETEKERLECQMEKKVPDDDQPDSDIIPELAASKQSGEIQIPKTSFSTQEMLPLLRSMNDKQKEVFYFVRQWCLDKANGRNPTPFHLFVTGGAGTGKSHLIKCLYYQIQKILGPTTPSPDDIVALLTAPTGTAAFNVGGTTIHSAFSLSKYLSLPYKPLRDDSINSLRAKLQHLQVLIIDEISMVDKKVLIYVSERLRQIKSSRSSSVPFGNISVIAVGDFYQLPPVKQGSLLKKDPRQPVNLFTDYFQLVELTQIMRQKDDAEFAGMLNRFRVRKKGEPLNPDDAERLQEYEQKFQETEMLHVFPTNKEVDAHNFHMAYKVCELAITITAKDYKKDVTTGKLQAVETDHQSPQGSLPAELFIGYEARVMLMRNIDVEDGLVNGVFGTVKEILPQKDPDSLHPGIYVLFDDNKVGRKVQTSNHNDLLAHCVLIKPVSEELGRSTKIRHQFPLQLAWACTVHKVQGATSDAITVSMGKIFSPGQAYVALSRCTSLSGLMIKDLDTDVIYCDKTVEKALNDMKVFTTVTANKISQPDSVNIILHNIQGLYPHFKDLSSNSDVHLCDFLCVTETWLTETDHTGPLLDFTLSHKTRFASYDTSTDPFSTLKLQSHGGVGVFHKRDDKFLEVDFGILNIEYMAFRIPQLEVTVILLYRPETYTTNQFISSLNVLLLEVQKRQLSALLIGDFNENAMKPPCTIIALLETLGFQQLVTKSTTDGDTLIDHVYCNSRLQIHIEIFPTYYSYHNMVSIQLAKE